MTTLPFTTVDVFTETPFKGNPLAVVTIPAGVTVSQEQKQAIAREFNLSETTFVHEVADPAATSERRFDIFTREAEIPFAGHPTIGTAAFLYPRGVRTLIAKAGPIAIEPMASGALRADIPHNVRLHRNRLPARDPASFPASQVEVAKAEAGSPLFSIVNGMAFALIELPSLEALGAVQFGAMPELPKELLDDDWNAGWVTRRYYFVRVATRIFDGKAVYKLRTRMVRQSMEDPATGSAACALAGYLSLHELEDQSITFEITQGVEMGRESDILVDTELGSDENGTRRLEALHLGGKAVRVMSGSVSA